MSVSKKQIAGYVLLPSVRPRLYELFATGFHYIPYFIALVYQIVRLLPANHPYLNPANIGYFGIRHVIAESANNLVISRKNIDQILLFFIVLMGMALIAIQIALLGFSFFIQPVMAQMPTNFAGFFITQDPSQDLAFIMLDMVFGVPDMFQSCVSTAATCIDTDGEAVRRDGGGWLLEALGFPFPVHVALHQLFQLYSIGLLVVAVLIASYFIATVVAETAQTGTAFGKRFNKVWAPIRIVVALGLLIPIAHGLNSAQYIVLYSAYFGSSFATNGWTLFNDTLGFNHAAGITLAPGTDNVEVVSTPNVPEVGGLLQMIYVAKICRELEKIRKPANPAARPPTFDVEPYLVKDPLDGANTGSLELNPDYGGFGGYTTYEEMLNFADGAAQVTLRFGKKSADNNPNNKGYVEPLCGEIIIPLTDPRIPGSNNPPDRGAEIMQRYYWLMIQFWWYCMFDECELNYPESLTLMKTTWDDVDNATLDLPAPEWAAQNMEFFKDDIRAVLSDPGSGFLASFVNNVGAGAVEEQKVAGKWSFDNILLSKGWGGAGIWYNRIAELNGSLSAAVYNAPIISRYPQVMEEVQKEKQAKLQMVNVEDRFNPSLPDNESIIFKPEYKNQYASAMWAGFDYWQAGGHGASPHNELTGNSLLDAINQYFGVDGLYSMRRNPDVHPLAQLVGVGRSLIQSAIMNLGLSAGAALSGLGLSATSKAVGEFAAVGIGFFMTITMIGMTLGFVLFYVVPFLPFIYFFFALGGWVKGIFEAMVGAPLWALAHIRIDGNGLPGQAAVNGYFLIFEIFLRPILIIFGLLAAISIFSALVSVLNMIWDPVTANLAGFDVHAEQTGAGTGQQLAEYFRGPVDQFFFTLIYTIVVYMMGMASFKLIDLIPNNILRWMGQSVKTFNDEREDPAKGLVGTASIGGQQAFNAVGGGVEGLLKGVAKGGGGAKG